MAMNGVGLSETVVFAPGVSQKVYGYRAGCGMVPSAEFAVTFDDFTQAITTNVPLGWAAAVIDTGATIVQYATLDAAAQGMISVVSTTASEGAATYMPKTVQFASGDKWFMEAKVKLSDVTDHAFQFGLTDLTATTNPEDLWTTTAASLIAMGIVDGAATLTYLMDKSNAGTARANLSGSMVADTWTTLGIGSDGTNVSFYKDGKSIGTSSTTVPTGILLAPFVGAINGNGAGSNVTLVDYIRWSFPR